MVAVVAKGTNAGDGVRPSGLVRGKGRRTLFQTPSWLAGSALAGLAAVVHAGALVLAPVAIVQPIGVHAVPFAVVIAAARTPHPAAMAAAAHRGRVPAAVTGFVLLANAHLGETTKPPFIGAALPRTPRR